jgi:hypothetical protein
LERFQSPANNSQAFSPPSLACCIIESSIYNRSTSAACEKIRIQVQGRCSVSCYEEPCCQPRECLGSILRKPCYEVLGSRAYVRAPYTRQPGKGSYVPWRVSAYACALEGVENPGYRCGWGQPAGFGLIRLAAS